MSYEAFNCRQTWVDLTLTSPTFTEIYYCVYTIDNLALVKLSQNQGKHLS